MFEKTIRDEAEKLGWGYDLSQLDQFVAAILRAVEEQVIGEDDDITTLAPLSSIQKQVYGKNILRHQQRETLRGDK